MGDDLRPLPLTTRKEALAAALQSPPAAIRYVEHLEGEHGPAASAVACRMGLEGNELGVRYVLEGSVRKVGNRVRITGQLIDAQSAAHHWAERYDSDLADIFALQ